MRKLTLRIVSTTRDLADDRKEHKFEIGNRRKLRLLTFRYPKTITSSELEKLSQVNSAIVQASPKDAKNVGVLLPEDCEIEVYEEG